MALTGLGNAVASGRAVPTARREMDWEFHKSIVCELVFAWQDAEPDGPVRATLERVMGNVGLDLADGQWTLPTPGGGSIVIG